MDAINRIIRVSSWDSTLVYYLDKFFPKLYENDKNIYI